MSDSEKTHYFLLIEEVANRYDQTGGKKQYCWALQLNVSKFALGRFYDKWSNDSNPGREVTVEQKDFESLVQDQEKLGVLDSTGGSNWDGFSSYEVQDFKKVLDAFENWLKEHLEQNSVTNLGRVICTFNLAHGSVESVQSVKASKKKLNTEKQR